MNLQPKGTGPHCPVCKAVLARNYSQSQPFYECPICGYVPTPEDQERGPFDDDIYPRDPARP